MARVSEFIKATEDFQPGDPSTHVTYSRTDPEAEMLLVKTPNDRIEPYDPNLHNDASQENGILPGYSFLKMPYCNYHYYKTKKDSKFEPKKPAETKKLEAALKNPPTQEEHDILYASSINAYLADGFDPNKGDSNKKWLNKSGCRTGKPNKTGGTNRTTKILVLEDKIFGGGYQPYIPSRHKGASVKAISVNSFSNARLRARKLYDQWCEKNNATISTTTTPSTTTTTSYTQQDDICDAIVLPGYRFFQPTILTGDSATNANQQLENRHSQTNRGKEEIYISDEQETDKDLSPSASPGSRKRKADEILDVPFVTKNRSSFFHDSDSEDDDTKRPSNNAPSKPTTSTRTSWRPWE